MDTQLLSATHRDRGNTSRTSVCAFSGTYAAPAHTTSVAAPIATAETSQSPTAKPSSNLHGGASSPAASAAEQLAVGASSHVLSPSQSTIGDFVLHTSNGKRLRESGMLTHLGKRRRY